MVISDFQFLLTERKCSAMKTIFLSLFLVAFLLGPAYAEAKKLPTLKSLSTPTCPACVQMSKVLDEINEKYAGKLVAEKVNVQENPEIAREYNVRYVPTLLFMDAEGKVVQQEVGYRSLDEVLEIFKKAGVAI